MRKWIGVMLAAVMALTLAAPAALAGGSVGTASIQLGSKQTVRGTPGQMITFPVRVWLVNAPDDTKYPVHIEGQFTRGPNGGTVTPAILMGPGQSQDSTVSFYAPDRCEHSTCPYTVLFRASGDSKIQSAQVQFRLELAPTQAPSCPDNNGQNPGGSGSSNAGGNGKSNAGGNGNGKGNAGGNGKSNAGGNGKSNAGGNGNDSCTPPPNPPVSDDNDDVTEDDDTTEVTDDDDTTDVTDNDDTTDVTDNDDTTDVTDNDDTTDVTDNDGTTPNGGTGGATPPAHIGGPLAATPGSSDVGAAAVLETLLRVHVVDEDGRPVAGAQVDLAGSGAAAADADGWVNFPGLALGSYQIHAAAEGFTPGSAAATLSESAPVVEVQILLLTTAAEALLNPASATTGAVPGQPAPEQAGEGSLSGSICADDPAGQVIARHTESGTEYTTGINADGTYFLTGLPAGTYSLTLDAPGAAPVPITIGGNSPLDGMVTLCSTEAAGGGPGQGQPLPRTGGGTRPAYLIGLALMGLGLAVGRLGRREEEEEAGI